MEETPKQAAQREFAKQAVALAFMILGLLIITAMTDKDFFQRLRMRAAAASSRVLSSLSRKAGHTSMGIELSTGRQNYGIPYWLSQMRDKAKAAYDKAKEH
jgi:hypothetical protein